ncbi:MAG: hypothetical protein GX580_12570 [Candidatus Hydrogenedens sp.]|nr:hypothetical protein [Candidatus Hydrogenedentota bacterium]NLF58459.1 hypothetical protein [Candidatus Hydrogenedens sp.]
MAFEHDVDTRKTLPELDPACFDEADGNDAVALLARRVGAKPLRKFSPADLYGAVSLNVGLPFVAPLAVALLEDDPLVQAARHPGDLLTAVLESDTRFWQEHHDLWSAMLVVLGMAINKITELSEEARRKADPDNPEGVWLPEYLGDDFMGALLHFRGIHRD